MTDVKPTLDSFDDVALLAKEGETNRVELKNSTFVELTHAGNQNKTDDCGHHRPITTPGALKTECRKMLAKECGAFANSNGGVLLIGFEDDGVPDTVPVPERVGKQLTHDWLAALLRDCLQPPLEKFDCRPVTGNGTRAIIIEIPESEKAPHQSLEDFRYYVRSEKSAIPAEHWVIEMVRNKRVHPKLELSLPLQRATVEKLASKNGESYLTLAVPLSITNTGRGLAEHWSLRIDCDFLVKSEILEATEFDFLNLPSDSHSGSSFARAKNILFPTQSAEAILQLTVPVGWKYEKVRDRLEWMRWAYIEKDYPPECWGKTDEPKNHWFKLTCTAYADDTQKVVQQFDIDEHSVKPLLAEHFAEEKKRTIVLTPDIFR